MEIRTGRDVVCTQCNKGFTSFDAADFNGGALCTDCLKRRKEVGHKVDEQIAERRRNNPQPISKGHEPYRFKNKGFIHYKQLR